MRLGVESSLCTSCLASRRELNGLLRVVLGGLVTNIPKKTTARNCCVCSKLGDPEVTTPFA
jgi:hypothetical protein